MRILYLFFIGVTALAGLLFLSRSGGAYPLPDELTQTTPPKVKHQTTQVKQAKQIPAQPGKQQVTTKKQVIYYYGDPGTLPAPRGGAATTARAPGCPCPPDCECAALAARRGIVGCPCRTVAATARQGPQQKQQQPLPPGTMITMSVPAPRITVRHQQPPAPAVMPTTRMVLPPPPGVAGGGGCTGGGTTTMMMASGGGGGGGGIKAPPMIERRVVTGGGGGAIMPSLPAPLPPPPQRLTVPPRQQKQQKATTIVPPSSSPPPPFLIERSRMGSGSGGGGGGG